VSADRLRRITEEATPGPWRIERAPRDYDRPDEPPACYGIVAGSQTEHRNKGRFHPDDAIYYTHEHHVVEIGYDRDYYTPEAAIPRAEDARLIALAPDLAVLVADAADLLRATTYSPPGWEGPEVWWKARTDAWLARVDQLTEEAS
jgi:hypothetical protein